MRRGHHIANAQRGCWRTHSARTLRRRGQLNIKQRMRPELIGQRLKVQQFPVKIQQGMVGKRGRPPCGRMPGYFLLGQLLRYCTHGPLHGAQQCVRNALVALVTGLILGLVQRLPLALQCIECLFDSSGRGLAGTR